MAAMIIETGVANLRRQLAGAAPGQSEQLQQQRAEIEDLFVFGRGYCTREDRFSYSFNPTPPQSLGGPEDFYMFQLGLVSSTRYWFIDHLLSDDGIFTNIYNNYDELKFSLSPADSTLLRARTHIRDYVRNGVYLNNLQANYFAGLGNGLYGQVYGGYLETMYIGASSELPYRPLDTSRALGVDVNCVGRRDQDNMMCFTNYSMPAGFVTVYWSPPTLNGILMKLSVEQYLAKDKGATVDVVECLDSSAVIGVWAAISNASKDDYGKGGFSKGFYIPILFDLVIVGPSRNRVVVSWTLLTHDDGQTLSRKYQLYPVAAEREVPAGQ